jgi:hypothetical protein
MALLFRRLVREQTEEFQPGRVRPVLRMDPCAKWGGDRPCQEIKDGQHLTGCYQPQRSYGSRRCRRGRAVLARNPSRQTPRHRPELARYLFAEARKLDAQPRGHRCRRIELGGRMSTTPETPRIRQTFLILPGRDLIWWPERRADRRPAQDRRYPISTLCTRSSSAAAAWSPDTSPRPSSSHVVTLEPVRQPVEPIDRAPTGRSRTQPPPTPRFSLILKADVPDHFEAGGGPSVSHRPWRSRSILSAPRRNLDLMGLAQPEEESRVASVAQQYSDRLIRHCATRNVWILGVSLAAGNW